MSPDPLRRVPTEDVSTSLEMAALCRAHPGRWAEVDVVVPEEGEAELRAVVHEAQDPAFAPAGSFQMTLSHPGRKLRLMYRPPRVKKQDKIDLKELFAERITTGTISAKTINSGKLYGKTETADEVKLRDRSDADHGRILKIVNGQLRPDADDLHKMTVTERRLWENGKRARTLAQWGLGPANEYGKRELIKEDEPRRSNHSGTYDRYGNYRGVMQPPSEYVPGDTNPQAEVRDNYYTQSMSAEQDALLEKLMTQADLPEDRNPW